MAVADVKYCNYHYKMQLSFTEAASALCSLKAYSKNEVITASNKLEMLVEQFAFLLASLEVDLNVADFISEFRIIPARIPCNCLTFEGFLWEKRL